MPQGLWGAGLRLMWPCSIPCWILSHVGWFGACCPVNPLSTCQTVHVETVTGGQGHSELEEGVVSRKGLKADLGVSEGGSQTLV
jgi:hypothetical protein